MEREARLFDLAHQWLYRREWSAGSIVNAASRHRLGTTLWLGIDRLRWCGARRGRTLFERISDLRVRFSIQAAAHPDLRFYPVLWRLPLNPVTWGANSIGELTGRERRTFHGTLIRIVRITSGDLRRNARPIPGPVIPGSTGFQPGGPVRSAFDPGQIPTTLASAAQIDQSRPRTRRQEWKLPLRPGNSHPRREDQRDWTVVRGYISLAC